MFSKILLLIFPVVLLSILLMFLFAMLSIHFFRSMLSSVEVLILKDLGWPKVLVEDDSAGLDVVVHFDIRFPNRNLC